ncbi:hypothetical protein [Enterococcus alishanensis]|nr:hypothetical protein [Enterococcus alishanensis]
MKNKECMNCGSTNFHRITNGCKCDYCGTFYPDFESSRQEKPSIDYTNRKNIKPNIIIMISITLSVIMLLIVFLVLKSNEESTPQSISTDITQLKANDKFPGKWTKGIYENVVVATKYYDANNEKYSFENGASYEELEKLVGKPDSVTTWEEEDYGMPPRATATWNKNKDNEYAGNSVTITYNKNTLMITDKSHY